ncbi:MAG: sigma-70 family RNA polymerase sigma factor [Bacteroidetes bacterium]|nr:sigma-70 family RNA polymerase sigma factor [Bacteroidota bacterium]MBP7477092.1 sigma-70 family RNA polymerase sigma factor [Chitinophagales bacterium]
MNFEENDLIQKCIQGDRLAQKALYEKFSRKMYYICLRYTTFEEEAEDILQDGFVKVFKSIQSFEGKGSFEGWIRRIVVNTAIEYYRKKSNHASLSELEDSEFTGFEEHTIESFSEKEILKLIQELPVGYRTVFNLYAIEGYSHKEIGEMLQISDGTSKSQLARARAILQGKVNDLYKNSNNNLEDNATI